jgi:hypothetical protein
MSILRLEIEELEFKQLRVWDLMVEDDGSYLSWFATLINLLDSS